MNAWREKTRWSWDNLWGFSNEWQAFCWGMENKVVSHATSCEEPGSLYNRPENHDHHDITMELGELCPAMMGESSGEILPSLTILS